LALSNLAQGLAVDAQRGRRPGFQPLDSDFNAAIYAISIISFLKIREGVIDFLDKFSFPIPSAQL